MFLRCVVHLKIIHVFLYDMIPLSPLRELIKKKKFLKARGVYFNTVIICELVRYISFNGR